MIAGADSFATAEVLLGGGTELDVTSDGVATHIGSLAGSSTIALGSQELILGGNNLDKSYDGILTGAS